MNLANNLRSAAFHYPESHALIDTDVCLTYQQLDKDSDTVAHNLCEMGAKAGDHIAICIQNSYQWVVFYFGVMKTGAVAVTLPFFMTESELDYVLSDCRPRILFTQDSKLKDISDPDAIKTIISDSSDLSFPRMVQGGSGFFDIIEREPDDTAAILYTGGTTGPPKGVMLTHQNILASSFNVAHHERSGPSDRALCFLPLNHVFAQIHIMNSTISSAGGLVILPSFDMDDMLEAIRVHKVTKLYAVPTVYIRLLRLEDIKSRLGSVRYCFSAAASMAKELVKEWKEKTGLDIYEAYGMTESASMVTYNHYHRHVVGSVGTPINLIEVKICDETGKDMGKNQTGEICIAGPNIMKGYLNRPEDTQDAFWGRWFRSGDVGMLDDDGYLYITDRIKELIITGGENVSPREVEEVLYTREEVEECAVIGLPDKEYGEKVMAYIVPRAGQTIDAEVFKKFMKERLSPFKVPKAFVEVSQLPKSGAGKLLKRELKQQALANMIPPE